MSSVFWALRRKMPNLQIRYFYLMCGWFKVYDVENEAFMREVVLANNHANHSIGT